ncbi:hypothetical protein ACIQCR_16765 [Streptomyces sp. NPDC093249]|uniref:hypothetical protein n=1 Tax=unclassified Streptomyces TaxID=2593676 RepID=UPI00344EF224
MTTTPNMTIKSSNELAQGDIVRTQGIRVRLDVGATHTRHGQTVYAWVGTVLNIDEIREQRIIPLSFLHTEHWEDGKGWVTDREDVWTVQGSQYVEWVVENPS